MNEKQMIVNIAVKTGETLLSNGAEIFRVQETIIRILEKFGIYNHSVYVISNGIFITVGENEEERYFSLRHVPQSSVHLGRIDAVNTLSRQIVTDAPTAIDLEAVDRQLEACKAISPPPPWLQTLACASGSGCFCYIFGGTFCDCLTAFCAGIILQLFLIFYTKKKRSRFVPTILGSGVVTLFAACAAYFFPILNLNNTIIGAIIPMVPGVIFTTAVREFFNGDFISGNTHLIEASLTGICIAVGVGSALQIWEVVFGGILP